MEKTNEEVQAEVTEMVKDLMAGEVAKGVEGAEAKQAETLAKVQEMLDDHKSKMERGVAAYAKDVDGKAQRKALNNFLREGIKSLMAGGDTKEFESARKEMTTDDSASPYAGYVTDDYLSAEIRHLVTEYGVAAREFTTVSFMQSSYKANNLATDVSVFWVDEAGSISSTQAVLGQETLELKKLATIVTLTRELMQEQEIDFVSFLGSRVAEAFAKAEDEAFFIGDGTSTYGGFTGLLENASVNEVVLAGGDTTFADITVEKMRAMQDATPQGALAGGKYYMHRSIRSQVRNLQDGAGNYIFKQEDGVVTLDGYPVVTVEAMPAIADTAVSTSFVLFGDLRQATIRGIRGGITVDNFNAGTVRNVADDGDINLITTDRLAVRWTSQVGYIAIIPTAVTKLTTAAA